jgi:hypothetical protein
MELFIMLMEAGQASGFIDDAPPLKIILPDSKTYPQRYPS